MDSGLKYRVVMIQLDVKLTMKMKKGLVLNYVFFSVR